MSHTMETKMVPVDTAVPADLDLVLRSRGLSRRALAAEAQRVIG